MMVWSQVSVYGEKVEVKKQNQKREAPPRVQPRLFIYMKVFLLAVHFLTAKSASIPFPGGREPGRTKGTLNWEKE